MSVSAATYFDALATLHVISDCSLMAAARGASRKTEEVHKLNGDSQSPGRV